MTGKKTDYPNKSPELTVTNIAGIAGEIRDEALNVGDLVPEDREVQMLAGMLSRYTVPEPSRAETAKLSAALLGRSWFCSYSPAHLARVIAVQLRFFPSTFWLGTLVIILGGMLATPYFRPGEIHLMVAAVPWLGSLGTLFGLGRSQGSWGELEKVAPVPPALLALGRTFACLGIATLSALVATAFAFSQGRETGLLSFILTWLAPLLLSAGLALIISLVYGPRRALAATAIIWALQTLFQKGLGPIAFLSLPGDPLWAVSKGLALLCAVACLAGAYIYLKRKPREGAAQI